MAMSKRLAAVSLGLVVGGRFSAADLIPYWVAQVLGAIAAAAVLVAIASGQAGFEVSSGLASNGYGEHSPGGYSLQSGLIIEVVMSFFFLLIILGAVLAAPVVASLKLLGMYAWRKMLDLPPFADWEEPVTPPPPDADVPAAGKDDKIPAPELQ